MRLRPTLLAVTLSLSCGIAFADLPNTQFFGKQNSDLGASAAYWTPERLRNAKPMPMPKVSPNTVHILPIPAPTDIQDGEGAPPTYLGPIEPQRLYTPTKTLVKDALQKRPMDRGTLNQDFSSSRLVPLTADVVYPYRTVGKLFFTIPNQGNYVCSASVLRPRVVLTAGHCVHSGSGGSGGYFTNWLFIPAFRDGAAPYQSWNWSYVLATSDWMTGGGSVPNAADYAMIEVQDRVINGLTRRLGDVTGYLGYQTLSLIPNHVHQLGYPCNLDSCQKMHQVTAESARSVAPNNVEYGSDMRGGASGGPWVQNFGQLAVGQTGGLNPGLNRVVGITSYGYVSTAPKALGSSIPDGRFVSLLVALCTHKVGNC